MNQNGEQRENLQKFLPRNRYTASSDQKPGALPVGTLCPKCGYDLRGIERGKPCPECGRLTLRLGNAAGGADFDSAYLRRVIRGVRLLMVGWLLTLPPPFVSIVVYIPDADLRLLLVIGLILSAWGVWLVTDESALAKAAGLSKSIRSTVARIAIITAAAGALIAFFYAISNRTLSFPMSWLSLSFFSLLVAHTAICVICQALADQMQDEPLGRRFWTVAWIIPLTGVIGVPFFVVVIGGRIMLICLVGLIIPILFLGSEVALVLFLFTLQSRFAWAIRYQYHEEARNERYRREMENAAKDG